MPSNVAFKVTGLCDTKSQAITGDIEAKYSDHKNGLVFTETWTTANVLKSQLELENYLAKGLKLDFATTLAPDTGNKSAVFNAIYKQSGVHTRGAFDMFKLRTTSPMERSPAYAAAIGYNAPEYAVTVRGLNNLNTFAASHYHRVSPDVEAGAKAVYDTKPTYLDSAAFVKAKINNVGVLALGYMQTLCPGVKVSFGLTLDTQRLNEAIPSGPAHKVGASFTFEA
ncbi:hypothetical protein SCLCIDRAFT_1220097 [Scleroderma citrinum Foug A]|uniref:Mitochondrial outer membrane protein porin n=1 Tax=Scleroderma citrinum Foug A TaxID=1036808 RepID=A0A0C3DL77_9AGAM|nr:hypothetical protein SCLCIDRAFT_1220097 [Scleroderma citrinum Foug A]